MKINNKAVLDNKKIRFLSDGVNQAVAALKDNRLRTALSILGIAVGIAAVMAVGAVSKSGRHVIFRELETFGLKTVWVRRGNDDVKDPNRTLRTGTGIDVADLDALSAGCCPATTRFTPVVNKFGMRLMIRAGGSYSSATVTGVGVEYLAINNDQLVAGRKFRQEDIGHYRYVAILGPTAAEDLFGRAQGAVGKDIRISNRKYLVIGLLQGKSRDFLASIGSSNEDSNNRILVPYTTFQQQLGSKDVRMIQAEAASLAEADTAVRQIVLMLERQHNRRYSYKAETMAQYIETANRILRGVSIIGVIAASISLLVGGMGIMNIISTSVLERTREIGLRKAIGATKRHILFQFLMESVVISMVGGVCGLAVGSIASLILAWSTGFPLTPSWPMVVLAFGVSILIGLISGFYPARRAANLHPVVALRYE